MKTFNFYRWLVKQNKRDDIVGDLAIDVLRDTQGPYVVKKEISDSKTGWKLHLGLHNACRGAYEAFDEAWEEFEGYLSAIERNTHTYRKWRMDVLKRDNFSCQKCGCTNREAPLHVHHIKSFAKYPKLRCEINNGKTLCSICHWKLHKNI